MVKRMIEPTENNMNKIMTIVNRATKERHRVESDAKELDEKKSSEKKSKILKKIDKFLKTRLSLKHGKKDLKPTYAIKAAPMRSHHFKEEFESEGDILKWK